ncbi:phosphatase [Aureococcus anophagefferens]|nr:phosphatase [Aureococcus anophagefferens]
MIPLDDAAAVVAHNGGQAAGQVLVGDDIFVSPGATRATSCAATGARRRDPRVDADPSDLEPAKMLLMTDGRRSTMESSRRGIGALPAARPYPGSPPFFVMLRGTTCAERRLKRPRELQGISAEPCVGRRRDGIEFVSFAVSASPRRQRATPSRRTGGASIDERRDEERAQLAGIPGRMQPRG